MKRGSLSAAAQEIGVTSPLVSKRLPGLEARLGVRLNLVEQGFDATVRLGELPDARLTARLLEQQ